MLKRFENRMKELAKTNPEAAASKLKRRRKVNKIFKGIGNGVKAGVRVLTGAPLGQDGVRQEMFDLAKEVSPELMENQELVDAVYKVDEKLSERLPLFTSIKHIVELVLELVDTAIDIWREWKNP